MRAGELDRRIRIEQPVETRDEETGEVETKWVPFAEVWAQRRDLRGREEYSAQQIAAGLDTRFRLRFLEGVTPKMRIVCEGVAYDIRPAVELGRREGLEILASRRFEAEEGT